MLDLSDDLEMSGVFSDLLAARQTMDTQLKLEAQLKQRIQQRMGDASTVVFETGEITWKRSKDGTALDTKALALAHPDLVQQFSTTKAGSRRFLVQG